MSSPSHEEIEQLVSEANRVARDYGAMRATDEEVETAIDNLAVAAYRALDTHPQAPASMQPEAEAQKAAVAEWQTPPASWRLLAKAAINLLCAIDEKHDTQQPPTKYAVPYAAVNDLRKALGGATPSAGAPLPEQQEAQVEALTDERIDRIADLTVKGMPDGIRGFMKEWGWRQFARNLAEILATPPASSRVAAPTPTASAPKAEGEGEAEAAQSWNVLKLLGRYDQAQSNLAQALLDGVNVHGEIARVKALREELEAALARPMFATQPPSSANRTREGGDVVAPFDRLAINPTHEAADAFWAYWRENGETHKHGYYESTWGAINRALRVAGIRLHDYGTTPSEGAKP